MKFIRVTSIEQLKKLIKIGSIFTYGDKIGISNVRRFKCLGDMLFGKDYANCSYLTSMDSGKIFEKTVRHGPIVLSDYLGNSANLCLYIQNPEKNK